MDKVHDHDRIDEVADDHCEGEDDLVEDDFDDFLGEGEAHEVEEQEISAVSLVEKENMEEHSGGIMRAIL